MKKFEAQIQGNPEIFAQMEIARAAFEMAARAEEVVAEMVETGLVKSECSVSVRPYNTGYEVKIDVEINHDRWKEAKELGVWKVCDRLHSSYLYPASFFASNFKAEYGAELSGNSLSLGADYFYKRVKTNEEIVETVSEWKNLSLAELDAISELAKSWK